MQKVPYDVIQKGKKEPKKLHKVFEHLNEFVCALKRGKRILITLPNFSGYFFYF